MPFLRSRFRPAAWLLSLPGLLVLMAILQVGTALLIYGVSRDQTVRLEVWILTIVSSTLLTLLSILPGMRREQRILETLITERTAALISTNVQLEQEIEERKQVEEALRQREATLRKVQEIAHIGSWEVDVLARSVTWSEEMYRIHGRDPNLPAPDPNETITMIHPEDREIHEQQVRQKVFSQTSFATDLRIVRPDGTIRYLEARGEPIFDENQRMVRYIGMSRDLTERKLTEEKLRKSEALLREAQTAARLGCWEHDFLTNQTTWTEGLYHIHGREPGTPTPSSAEFMASIVYPEDLPIYREQVFPSIRTIEPFTCDLRIIRLDGDIRWVTIKGEPILNSQGELIRYVGIVMDITDRKQAELELHRAKETAETANRSKSIFLSTMSHELRTPLNAILGFAQLLNRDTTLTNEQQHYIDTINRNGQHLLELINDVLEVSKIESGQVTLHPSQIDLYRLLDNLDELFQLRAIAKNLTLTFEKAATLPQFISIDESKLRQILINLLSNAIKFTSQGNVTLRVNALPSLSETPAETRLCSPTASRDGAIDWAQSLEAGCSTLYFEVQDTGSGIAPTEFDKLFKPFSQTSTGLQASEGTGLGLAISRSFVELMQGEIGVNSNPGEGSLFWVKIPVKFVKDDPVATQLSNRKVLSLEPDQPSYRILIVEDHAENAQFLNKILSLVGFEVKQARDGEAGLLLWETWKPHLILMDMRMPRLDGYETSRRIRALESQADDRQNTIIIAVTGSAFEENRTQILAIGCDDFIRKPFQENLLFARLAHHLKVRFRYESGDSEKTGFPTAANVVLAPEALNVMPTDWIAQLNGAARECDQASVLLNLDQIPQQYEGLSRSLRLLATNFRFEDIAALSDRE